MLGIVLLFNAMAGNLSDDLLESTESGHPESVAVILDQENLSRDVVYENGDEALFLAVEKGYTEIVQTLLDTLYERNILTDRYITPALDEAEKYRYTGIVQILKEARQKAIKKRPSAPKEDKPASLARSFTVEGVSCEIRGSTINVSAGKDVSTFSLPQGCSLTPR